METLVSVIVPVYNVQNYLNKCLDSLANQTYTNYEVILVNDGSTDKSLTICEEYAEKYPFFRLINQENSGVSVARNKGLDEAKGTFLTFVDSDDYISNDYIAYLMSLVKDFRVNAAVCAHQTIWPNSLEVDTNVGKVELITDKEYFRRLGSATLPTGVGIAVHNKIFHRSLFDSIRFNIGQTFGEDSDIIYKLLLKSKNLVVSSKVKYFYLKRSGSAVESKFNMSRMYFIYSEQKMADAVLKVYPDLINEMTQRLTHVKMNTLAHMLLADKPELTIHERKLRLEILKNYHLILDTSTVPKRDKIAMRFIKIGLLPYKLLYRGFKFKQKLSNVRKW